MAIAEKITGTITGTSPFGKYYPHPMMSAGSLALFDPTHSLGAFSGVPAGNAPIPNVASEIAMELTGGTASEVSLVAQNDNIAPVGASIKERSGAGGLVGIYSHASPSSETGQTNFGVKLPLKLREYLFNNIDNAFFISVWTKMLRAGRPGPSGNGVPQAFAAGATNTNAFLFYYNGAENHANTLGQRNAGANTQSTTWNAAGGTPVVSNSAVSSWSGALPSSAASYPTPFFMSGDGGAWGNYNQPGPSLIVERVYMEDLTVSGRTYAELDALDVALHAAAHSVGGAFYNDTYTDPATLP